MIVARYAGKMELDLKLKDAVKAQQTNLDAIQLSLATAKILERIVLGSSIFVCPHLDLEHKWQVCQIVYPLTQGVEDRGFWVSVLWLRWSVQ